MQTVIEKLMESDLILWSFPLYYFNVPGILKEFDRSTTSYESSFYEYKAGWIWKLAVMKPDMIWKAKGMC